MGSRPARAHWEATVEFLGVGYQELLLVLVLMLVVVGPERLPQVAYQIGRAVRQMQRYARTVRDEFSEEFSVIQEQYDTVRGEVNSARTEFRRQQQELSGEVKDATKSIEQAVPDELKGRGNVIPITSAAPRAAAASPNNAAATEPTPGSSPSAESAPPPAPTANPVSAEESNAGVPAKPPLVF